jgi:hypothetical protein
LKLQQQQEQKPRFGEGASGSDGDVSVMVDAACAYHVRMLLESVVATAARDDGYGQCCSGV